jgi:acyl-coenzyme A thioesterase PaaI-like protein
MPDAGKSEAERSWVDGILAVDPGSKSLPTEADVAGGPELGPFLESMRCLQDAFAGSAPPTSLQVELTVKVNEIADELAKYEAPEADRVDGRRLDLPGRGSLLIPPFVVDELTETSMRGRVVFSRFHLGGGGTIHGGAPPLIFDDVFGIMAHHGMAGVARTVNLVVDYRAAIPLGVEVLFEASRDRVEGRKRFVSARVMSVDHILLTEARGLFIELKPGQV